MQKQGIITILDSTTSTNTVSSASSLRRTLSADMSSKNWLSQTISTSEELVHAKTIGDWEDEESNNKELEDEAERERLEIWSSIQRNKKEEQEKSGSFDTWSSIISLKGKDEISKSLPVSPYVHPLVKRSKSCLSEKSLQICTESLGSETGSDGLLFSSYSSSETGDAEEEEEKVVEATHLEEEEELSNYASVVATKKASSPTRAFPPPLPSLSHQQAGPSLHMRSRRDNGRLVLEAVSVPSHNNFSIQRQGGRLVLSFSNHQEEEEEEVEEEENDGWVEQEYSGGLKFEEDETEEEEEYNFGRKPQVSSIGVMEYESVKEKGPLLSSGVTRSVHGLALMMNKKNKAIGVVNRNPKWKDKFNEMTNFDDVNMAQSLPPRPRVARLIPSPPAVAAAAAAASFNFNAYEYYWRTNSASSKGTSVKLNPLDQNKKHHHHNHQDKVVVSGDMNKVVSREQQQLVVLRGENGDYLVQNLKSCKDSRRSFLFWEPYCIATS